MTGHLAPDLLDFISRWLPTPPARVVEVGCGDGSLTTHLRERGHRAIGIDPEAPEGEAFIATTVERFRTDDPFDAAVAIRSLHHVGDLPVAIDSLHAALRPGGRLVLFEFAVENVDEPARRWQAEAGLRETRTENLHDVIPLSELRRALRRRFRELAFEPAPYLAREADREDLLARVRCDRGEPLAGPGMRPARPRPRATWRAPGRSWSGGSLSRWST